MQYFPSQRKYSTMRPKYVIITEIHTKCMVCVMKISCLTRQGTCNEGTLPSAQPSSYLRLVVCQCHSGKILTPRVTKFATKAGRAPKEIFFAECETLTRNLRAYFLLICRINLLKTKHNLLYIRKQSVPCSKHFAPR